MINLRYIIFLTFLNVVILFCNCFSQGQGDVWAFGDSAMLKLQVGMIIIPGSKLNTIEASASIADSSGNLLFYAGGYNILDYSYVKIFNYQHQVMMNGDSIFGSQTITNGLLILPFPSDSNKYYLFSRSTLSGGNSSLYYSIVDMSINGGLGSVIQKNVLLYNQSLSEKLAAVKHGNGRDWWLLVHPFSFMTDYDRFTKFLVTPNGIALTDSQSIGSLYSHASLHGLWGEIQFSNEGNKLLAVGTGIIDLFDFDRCSGILSNYQTLAVTNPLVALNEYYGCSFSYDGSKIYVSNWSLQIPDSNKMNQLVQYDLNAPNIIASKTIIFTNVNTPVSMGQHQIARNNKIYIASTYGSGFPTTYFNNQNMNLSVINYPDSLGLGCSFSPYSISLGGRRCYLGLPNIPNYNLGADEGSACDTLTGIVELNSNDNWIKIYPNPMTDNVLNIGYLLPGSTNFGKLNEQGGLLQIYDVTGKVVFKYDLPPWSHEQTFNLSQLSNGVYNCVITSGVCRVSKKVAVIKL